MLVAREVILSMLDLEMGCPEPVDVAYATEAVSYLTRWAEVGTTRKKRLDTDGVITLYEGYSNCLVFPAGARRL